MPTKILVVDDQAADLLAQFLRADGYSDVFTAVDGAQAVQIATKEEPDLVLLDIVLPVLDGFEVLEQLKKRRIKTRVIMCSGHQTGIDTAVRCVRSGACDFLEKPFDRQQLLERTKRCLLVDHTLNLHVSEMPPSIDLILTRAQALEQKLETAGVENQQLRKGRFYTELLTKVIYVALSLTAVLVLNYFHVATGTLSLVLVFVFLVMLLMVPIDRIQRITAGLKDLKAKIDLNKHR